MGSLDVLVHLILWRREFAWRRCSTVDSGASESDSETYAEWQYPTWLQCQDKAPRRPRSWVFSQGVVCSFLFFLRSWLTRISLTFPCTYAGTTTNLLPHPWWFEPHTGWSCLFQIPPSIIKCLLCIIIYYVLLYIIYFIVLFWIQLPAPEALKKCGLSLNIQWPCTWQEWLDWKCVCTNHGMCLSKFLQFQCDRSILIKTPDMGTNIIQYNII